MRCAKYEVRQVSWYLKLSETLASSRNAIALCICRNLTHGRSKQRGQDRDDADMEHLQKRFDVRRQVANHSEQ